MLTRDLFFFPFLLDREKWLCRIETPIPSDGLQSEDITFLGSRMKLELLLLPCRSNFFATIKSSKQRKWITLRKIASRFLVRWSWINHPLERAEGNNRKDRRNIILWPSRDFPRRSIPLPLDTK